MHRIALVLVLIAVRAAVAADFADIHGFEPHFQPPPGAGIVNIRAAPYNAKGDGVSDDTAAFKAAIEADQPRAIWIPAGTYLIRDQLRYGAAADKKKRTLLIGERRSTTILRLADAAPGFGSAASPKAFLHTRKAEQQGEQNFAMYVQHLTVEIGSGNPGAIGIVFHTNNSGAIKDVTVRARDPVNGRGHTGIAFDDYWFGPGDGRFLAVRGFATGIRVGSAHNHATLEHVTIDDCATGLSNGNNVVSVRDLRVRGCTTGVVNAGMMTLLDLDSAGSGGPAVRSDGDLLAVDLRSAGHSAAIAGGSQPTVPVGPVAHHVSAGPHALWPAPASITTTLGLPVQESPEYQYPGAGGWTVIGGSDMTVALQAAIDGGATDVMLTGASLSGTVTLRGALRRIIGAGVHPVTYGRSPAYRLAAGSSPVVVVERLYENYGSVGGVVFEHASPRTFVLRHGGGGYRSVAAARGARVFMESVIADQMSFIGVDAWVRDLNTELGGADRPNVVNDGGRLWLLGHKTEDYATKLKTVNGGQTELLGGTYRQNWDAADGVDALLDTDPLFVVEDARATFCYSSWPNAAGIPPYKVQVRETRAGVTRSWIHTAFGGPAPGGTPLFTAAASTVDTTPPAAPTGLRADPR